MGFLLIGVNVTGGIVVDSYQVILDSSVVERCVDGCVDGWGETCKRGWEDVLRIELC